MAEVAVFISTVSVSAIAGSGKGTPPKGLSAAGRRIPGSAQNMRRTVIRLMDVVLTWDALRSLCPVRRHGANFLWQRGKITHEKDRVFKPGKGPADH